jgi:hypothetical protein
MAAAFVQFVIVDSQTFGNTHKVIIDEAAPLPNPDYPERRELHRSETCRPHDCHEIHAGFL